MTPQLFEAILFLRENETFWDIELFAEVIGKPKQCNKLERLEAHLDQEERIDDM